MVRFVELFRLLIYLLILEKADSVSPLRKVSETSDLSNPIAKCSGQSLNLEDCSMALLYFKRYSGRFLSVHNRSGWKRFSFGYEIRPGINQSLPLDLVVGTCLLRVDTNFTPLVYDQKFQTSWYNLKEGADNLFEQCVNGRHAPIEGYLEGDYFRIAFMKIIPISSREIAFSEHERARLITAYTSSLGLILDISQVQKELGKAPMLIRPQINAPPFGVKHLSRDRESHNANCDTNSGQHLNLNDCKQAFVEFVHYKNRFLEHYDRESEREFCFGFEPRHGVDHYLPLDIRWGTCLIRVDIAESYPPSFDGIMTSWDSIFQGVNKIYEQCIIRRYYAVEGYLVSNALKISVTWVDGTLQDHRVPSPFRVIITGKPLGLEVPKGQLTSHLDSKSWKYPDHDGDPVQVHSEAIQNGGYDRQEGAGPSRPAQTPIGVGDSLALPWKSSRTKKERPSGIEDALAIPSRPSKKPRRQTAAPTSQANSQGPDPRSTYEYASPGFENPPDIPPPDNQAARPLSDVIPETESDEDKWYGVPRNRAIKPIWTIIQNRRFLNLKGKVEKALMKDRYLIT
jgi:hypothetical protein